MERYVPRLIEGSLPALELSDTAARSWLESYSDQIVQRDATSYGEQPDPTRLRRYLEAYSINSAQTATHNTVYDAAGVTRKTAIAYDALLRDLAVVDELPAWSTNRLKRLSRSPKRYVIDSGLLGGMLRVGLDDVLADSRLLGGMIDTLAVAQLRAQAVTARTRYRLSHLREHDGRREVDVIAEFSGGRIVGIEIKTAAGVNRSDARHLIWLRDAMQDRFAGGVVLHTGKDCFELAEGVTAAPLSALWS